MGKSDFTVEVRKYRRSLGQVLVSISPYPVIKVNGKLLIQQPNQGRTTNGLDTSGMKVWVMPAGEELQPAGMTQTFIPEVSRPLVVLP